MHRHVGHLKPSISPIIEERRQTHAHDLILAANINKAVNDLFRNEHCVTSTLALASPSSFFRSTWYAETQWRKLANTISHIVPRCSASVRGTRTCARLRNQSLEMFGSRPERWLDLRRGGEMMRSDVTSGPLATSNVALLEAWRGRSLVICHDRNQHHHYYDIFETQL